MAFDPQPPVPSPRRHARRWRMLRVVVALGAVLKALAFAGVFGYVALSRSIEQALPLLAGPVLGAICLVAFVAWRRRRTARVRDASAAAPAAEMPASDDLAA